ncbi:hypothetical protein Bca101_099079 [Brassica carinata]
MALNSESSEEFSFPLLASQDSSQTSGTDSPPLWKHSPEKTRRGYEDGRLISEDTMMTVRGRASLMWKREVFGTLMQRRKWICCGKNSTKNRGRRREARVLGSISAEIRDRLCFPTRAPPWGAV